MPIPETREELVAAVRSAFDRLLDELERAGGSEIAALRCVDDWTVKDVLAVRAWWTTSVIQWVEAGERGEVLDLPAAGYTWRETPRLNRDIVERAATESYEKVLDRLERGQRRVLATIDRLDDGDLLEPHRFDWAGRWPIARWISLNTARQYTTARAHVRAGLRNR